MALFDFLQNNPDVLDDPAKLQVLGSIVNPDMFPMTTEGAPVEPTAPMTPVQEAAPVSDAQEPNWLTRTGGALAKGFGGGDDWADNIIQGAMMFNASRGTAEEADAAMGSYAQRMAQRRAESKQKIAEEKADAIRKEQTDYDRARQSQDFDMKARQWATPESFMEYQQSGDVSKLVKAPEEMTEYQRQSLDMQRANHADSMSMQRARLGASSGSGSSVIGSGSFAEGNNEFGAYKNAQGQWVVDKTYANGRTVQTLVGPQQAKMLSESEAAQKPSANELQLETNFRRMDQLIESDAHKSVATSGPIASLVGDTGRRVANLYASPETQELNSTADEIDAQLGSLSIEQARAMGASGINSIPEFELFRKNMPKLDRSSPERFVQSYENIKRYIRTYRGKAPDVPASDQITTAAPVPNPVPAAAAPVTDSQSTSTPVSKPVPAAQSYGSKYGF